MKRGIFLFLVGCTPWFSIEPVTAGVPCYPWDNYAWMTAGAAVIGIGGGTWAGYVAGHNRQRFSGDVTLVDPLCSFRKSEQKIQLAWILPQYQDLVGNVTIAGEIFRPDHSLLVRSTLTPSGAMPIDIPPLGGEGNPALIGEYTVLFTLEEDVSSAPNGLFMGGVSLIFGGNVYPIQSDPIFSDQPANIVPAGTQISLTIPYPDGPFGPLK